jgi:exodeoxyribonuclease VII large subunit
MTDLLVSPNILHHNSPELSVSEISGLLKKLVETNFDYVRIRGEMSGLKIAPSGHMYFSLKDENAVLNCVCWKGTVSKMTFKAEDGLEVICVGSVTTFAGQSKYQLVVESFEPAGVGALMAIFIKRKEMLAKEGLFAQDRKKKLPFLPSVIGIVTSPTGAVIQDILHRLQDRFPSSVLLWPVLVQGDQAAEQIVTAITGFNKLPFENIVKPDVLIVARGGGSIEDLWAFNEEVVVRAVAASNIPIISAVGHETDTTLIDFASDVRAPTPTAAAEMAVPVLRDLYINVKDLERRLEFNIGQLLEQKLTYIQSLVRALPNVATILSNFEQRLDDLSIRLSLSLPRFTEVKEAELVKQSLAIKNPLYLIETNKKHIEFIGQLLGKSLEKNISQKEFILNSYLSNLKPTLLERDLSAYTEKVKDLYLRLNNAYTKSISEKHNSLTNIIALIECYHYSKTLERGYAVIRNKAGQVITSVKQLSSQEILTIEFKDGSKTVTVN